MRERRVGVTMTEKAFDPEDGGPVFILRVDVSKRDGWSTILYENLDQRGSSVVDEIREWCVDQWSDEEFAFNSFDNREIWVRSLAQAMAFKMRWDGKHYDARA